MIAAPLETRWLLAAVVGFAGVLAFYLVQSPESPPEPEFICTIPDVELTRRIAVPQPNNPQPSISDRRVVIADLLSRGSAMPDCGTFFFESTMVFTNIYADSATLRVLVPCAEMPRPMYSSAAGDAPKLREQARYRLVLSGPVADDPAGKNDLLWRADRIDLVRDPIPQRPAIADRMCHDVWSASCPRSRAVAPTR
jgi:hypothetical protein